MTTTLPLRIAFALLAIGWLALAGGATSRAQSARAGAELPVHVMVPLAGPEAFLGTQVKATLDIAEKLINSRGDLIRIVYHDDQSKPDIAVQLLAQMSLDRIPIFIGPAGRNTCLALSPLLTKGPVDYCLSPTMHAERGSNVFMTGVDTYDLDRAMVRYARLRGWKRLALITSTDATGNDAAFAFDMIMKERDNVNTMALVERATFSSSDISVAAQLARIKAAQPDAIFAWSTGTGIGTVFKGLNQMGIDLPVATSFGNMTFAQMRLWADFLPKELYFPTTSWSASPNAPGLDPRVATALKELNSAFAAIGAKPDSGAAVAWDSVMIIARVLRKVGPDASVAAVREGLMHMKGFAGINGLYDFEKHPQRGLGDENAVVTRWIPERGSWDVVSKPFGIPLPGSMRR
jgi:branched-chain amino acid transport system substrate-binding protein